VPSQALALQFAALQSTAETKHGNGSAMRRQGAAARCEDKARLGDAKARRGWAMRRQGAASRCEGKA
jgi:hypothetical protein